MKHIESIQPEYAADDMTALLLSDATATAALTRLLHDWTGCAIPQTDDTPQSEVEELVPLAVSILRRHWTTPLTALGDGTTPMSLADLLRRLIGDRVQGNESLGIPPANDNIPAAVAALRERKISGVPEAPDGLSFARLLCDSTIANTITELIDDNIGWTANNQINCNTPVLPNLESITLGCRENISYVFYVSGYNAVYPSLREIHFPNLEIGRDLINTNAGTSGAFHPGFANVTTMTFPKLREILPLGGSVSIFRAFISRTVPSVTKLEFPELTTMSNYLFGGKALTGLQELRMPKLEYANQPFFNTYQAGDGCPNLVLLEVGNVKTTLNISFWNPTDKGSLFLSNFQTYIADRVADRTGKTALTLTLSAAVYEALQAQEGQTILATLTNKNWNVAQA